jgi:hypothetical protein
MAMSYHGRLNIIDCDARMKALDVGKARRLLEEKDLYVESCFLDGMQDAANASVDAGLTDAMIEIQKDRCWFSGNHVSEESLALIAHMIVGTLSGYFVGEDGSLYGGFRIENGVFTEQHLTVTLTPWNES